MRRNNIRSIRNAPLLFLLMGLVLFHTACPSEKQLDQAARASREIAYDVTIANKLVGEFYLAGKFGQGAAGLARKDAAAKLLGEIGAKGNALNVALIALDAKYPKGTPPPQDLVFIKQNIGEISALFRELFSSLDLFAATAAVSDLKTDVQTIEKVREKL